MGVEIHVGSEPGDADNDMAQVVRESTLTCPECGYAETLDIPLHY